MRIVPGMWGIILGFVFTVSGSCGQRNGTTAVESIGGRVLGMTMRSSGDKDEGEKRIIALVNAKDEQLPNQHLSGFWLGPSKMLSELENVFYK